MSPLFLKIQDMEDIKASKKYNYRQEVESIMIRLLNIKRIGNIIKCDYIPESAEISTPIEYDLQSETFIKFSNPKGYEYCRSFSAKISNYFRNNLDYLPKNATIMWC